MYLSTEKKIMDLANRLVVAYGEEEGVEWTGSLGLIDENYCIWSGYSSEVLLYSTGNSI